MRLYSRASVSPRCDAAGLIVALSGRLLAEAAVAAGLTVDVADLFGDTDCRAAARHHHPLPGTPDGLAWQPEAVVAWVQAWARRHPGRWLLPGTGFEAQPDLLAACATWLPLAGNPAAVVTTAKDPTTLAAHCADLGVGFPVTRTTPPPAEQGQRQMPQDKPLWLFKPAAGCGGLGIQTWTASAGSAMPPPGYWQHRLAGTPVSLLFLATAAGCTPIAVHQQVLAPSPAAPFRFGGVIAWPDAPAALVAELQRAASGLAARLNLRGLNGLDGVWDGNRLWVLEINPRPPLSLTLQPPAHQGRLLRAHLRACLPTRTFAPRAVHADARRQAMPEAADREHRTGLSPGVALVYASRSLSIPADFRFPPNCHDVPALPATLPDGVPVCSVHVPDGGLGELRTEIGYLRECLLSVAGVESLSSL